METLPIDAAIPEILALAAEKRRLVLVAPPGSGKTTRVAPALAVSRVLSAANPAVVLLQPRRVASRAAASRIAEERGWKLGGEVGYHIRNDRRIGPRTIVRVLTEGILTRQLLHDPFLDGVGAVILDEFHERSLDSDLALALVRESANEVREDLILIVMSATLHAEPVAEFLGGCPIVRVEGRTFPVTIEYRPSLEKTPIAERVCQAVGQVAEGERSGDVLVFLPGVEEIRRSARGLEPLASRNDWLVLPLHGSLPAEEQDRALRPADRRKIVLATNVAETSLTIDGVTTVIDSGLARFARHDPAKGLDKLELGRISRASASQRAGRAGRTAPGVCVRLWSEREDRGLREFDEPEVLRVDLASTILAIKVWGHVDPTTFGWFQRPGAEALEAAERLLIDLGAVDELTRVLTPIGHRLLALPVHPRLGRLIIEAADRGRLEEGASLAAILSEKDLLIPLGRGEPRDARETLRGDSDLFVRLDALEEARRERFSPRLRDRGIDPIAARRVDEVRRDLVRIARDVEARGPDLTAEDTETALLELVLISYPDRVCRRRDSDPFAARMVGGRGVRLDRASTVRDAEFFVALDPFETLYAGKREARVRIASAIDSGWLLRLLPQSIRRERTITYDENRGRAIARDVLFYKDLIAKEYDHGLVSIEESSRAMAEWMAPRAREFLGKNEAANSWLDRLEFLRGAMPEADLPAMDDAALGEILATACSGKKTMEDVERAPIVPLLKGRLSFFQSQMMDKEAPETIEVPTGNRIRLKYELGRPPVLAVRLQELFGLAETPRVAGGRVPVLLHLLGPNYRPVQVTDDLRSFWTSTYFQVRKDLRSRYPKHAWPEDPWTARPEAKGKRSS